MEIARLGYFMLWGHGIDFRMELIQHIEKAHNFEILRIQRHRFNNLNRFIKVVYGFDYAPISHLKDKLRYLKKVPPEVFLIFFSNKNYDVDYFGSGSFRHSEQVSTKNLKQNFRSQYNPKESGVPSEHHVIHSSDNEDQVLMLARYLSLADNIFLPSVNSKLITSPSFIDLGHQYSVEWMEIDQLRAQILIGNDWCAPSTKVVKICETPHFKFIKGNETEYIKYLKIHLGGGLKAWYSASKFQSLIQNFHGLLCSKYFSPILVKSVKGETLIVDGLHRASCAKAAGIQRVQVCLIK